MDTLTKSIANNALAALTKTAPRAVTQAIHTASSKTGVDFAYLMQQAKAESSFNPAAKAKTSSASGLFQFIERTWLDMVDRHGEKHGIDTKGMSRDDILAMRFDTDKASAMAAELAAENKRSLQHNWGGDIGATELYFAHFLGAGQAASFLNARDENGLQPAAYLFPAAAKANRAVFYDSKTGEPRSLDSVYAFFDKKFSIEEGSAPAGQMTAKPDDPMQALTDQPTLEPIKTKPRSFVFERTKPALSYGDLIAQPLEILLLAQALDMPLNTNTSTNKDSDNDYKDGLLNLLNRRQHI